MLLPLALVGKALVLVVVIVVLAAGGLVALIRRLLP